MDYITLICEALTAGALVSLQSTASQIVKDSYKGLKKLILGKVHDKTKVENVLIEHEKKPSLMKTKLNETLNNADIDESEEIIQMANKILALTNSHQSNSDKFNIELNNSNGIAIGDNLKVTMNFNKKETKRR